MYIHHLDWLVALAVGEADHFINERLSFVKYCQSEKRHMPSPRSPGFFRTGI
jgi:hypothetical protein